MSKALNVKSKSKTEFIDITEDIKALIKESGVQQGVCYIYVPHTTAGVTINEGADPDNAGFSLCLAPVTRSLLTFCTAIPVPDVCWERVATYCGCLGYRCYRGTRRESGGGVTHLHSICTAILREPVLPVSLSF